jgi:hypothetical protein
MIKTIMSRGTVLVHFELPATASTNSVAVCGDFNQWSPAAHPLTRAEGGRFQANVELTAGRRWHFRYLLDGERWENDWAADDYVANVHGTEDSVVDLTDITGMPAAPADSPPDTLPDQDADPATIGPEATPEPVPTAAATATAAKPRKAAAKPRKTAASDVDPVAAPTSAPTRARKKLPDGGDGQAPTASGAVKPRRTTSASPARRRSTGAGATPPEAQPSNGTPSTTRRRKPPAAKPGSKTSSGGEETAE